MGASRTSYYSETAIIQVPNVSLQIDVVYLLKIGQAVTIFCYLLDYLSRKLHGQKSTISDGEWEKGAMEFGAVTMA